jgi:hypothetical protein
MLDDRIAVLDAWIKKQQQPDLSRPEATRQLIEIGLRAWSGTKRPCQD